MPVPRPAGLLPAALSLFVLLSPAHAAPAFTLDPDPEWRRAATLAELTDVLEAWLDARGVYTRKPPPVIRLIDGAQAASLQGISARMGQRTRGLYDAATGTVYLVGPWSMDRAQDVSVLLHELVHHRQAGARHWYCGGAQEPEAYELQSEWLAERGLSARIDRIAVVLEAGCTPRDIHPD